MYDTANSGYITLADVKQMVLEFIDFQVVDAKSGDDLTRSILLQIILEEESVGVPMFCQRDAVADDPLLRQCAAGHHGQVHGAERPGVHGHPEKLQDQAKQIYGDKMMLTPDLWKQFLQMQAPAMQGMLGNYLEQSAKLFMDMQQRMQDQTRGHVLRVPLSRLRPPAQPSPRRREKALMRAKRRNIRIAARRILCARAADQPR